MIEVLSPFEAVHPLVAQFANVHPVPLGLGILFQLLKLGALGAVWLQILRSALPDARIRVGDALTPYLAGTGANAVLPAKLGLATRIVLARRLIPTASYETLTGTMLTEAVLGLAPMLLLMAVAAATGILWSTLAGTALAAPGWLGAPVIASAVVAGIALGAAASRPRTRRRVAEGVARVRQGMRIVNDRASLRGALVGQFVAWTFRLASIACFLAAFGIAPSPRVVVLVVIAQVLATCVPVGPTGVGAQQGLIVVVLAGVASAGTALAFGVGMQAAVIVADVLAGVGALILAGGGWSSIGWRLRPEAAAEAPAAGGG